MVYFILACLAFQLWIFVKGRLNVGYSVFVGTKARLTVLISFALQLALYFVMHRQYRPVYIILAQIAVFLLLPWFALCFGIVNLRLPRMRKHG